MESTQDQRRLPPPNPEPFLGVLAALKKAQDHGFEEALRRDIREGRFAIYSVDPASDGGPQIATGELFRWFEAGATDLALLVSGDSLHDWLSSKHRERDEAIAIAKARDETSPTVRNLARELCGSSEESRGAGAKGVERTVKAETEMRRRLFQLIADGQISGTYDLWREIGSGQSWLESGLVLPRNLAWCFVAGSYREWLAGPNAGWVYEDLVRVERAAAERLGFKAERDAAQTTTLTAKQQLAAMVAQVDRETEAKLQWPELFSHPQVEHLCAAARVASAEALRKLAEVRALNLPERRKGRGISKASKAA